VKYTGVQFDGFSLIEAQRNGLPVAVLAIGESASTMAFERVGTYPLADGKQRTAFSQGTVYVRHGAKSEPATTEDLRRIIERRIQAVRKPRMDGWSKEGGHRPGRFGSLCSTTDRSSVTEPGCHAYSDHEQPVGS